MSTTFSLTIDEELARAIDKWRGDQSPIPARNKAIRAILRTALNLPPEPSGG